MEQKAWPVAVAGSPEAKGVDTREFETIEYGFGMGAGASRRRGGEHTHIVTWRRLLARDYEGEIAYLMTRQVMQNLDGTETVFRRAFTRDEAEQIVRTSAKPGALIGVGAHCNSNGSHTSRLMSKSYSLDQITCERCNPALRAARLAKGGAR